MASFAAMLTYEHLGIDRARAVIYAAKEQVALLACEDPDFDIGSLNLT